MSPTRTPKSTTGTRRRTTTAHLATATSSPVPSGATTYTLDMYRAESRIEPFVLDTGEETIVIDPPTGETLLVISETSLYEARTLLSLICGAQFDQVWAAVKDEPGNVLVGLLQDLGKHFMVTSIQAAPGGPVALPG